MYVYRTKPCTVADAFEKGSIVVVRQRLYTALFSRLYTYLLSALRTPCLMPEVIRLPHVLDKFTADPQGQGPEIML